MRPRVECGTATHAALLPGNSAILLLHKAIEFGLHTLNTKALTIGELAIEALVDLLPLLAQVNTVVTDKIQFLLFVFRPWRLPAICAVGRQSFGMTSMPLP
jgi:uncharacterized integral membrane protein